MTHIYLTQRQHDQEIAILSQKHDLNCNGVINRKYLNSSEITYAEMNEKEISLYCFMVRVL